MREIVFNFVFWICANLIFKLWLSVSDKHGGGGRLGRSKWRKGYRRLLSLIVSKLQIIRYLPCPLQYSMHTGKKNRVGRIIIQLASIHACVVTMLTILKRTEKSGWHKQKVHTHRIISFVSETSLLDRFVNQSKSTCLKSCNLDLKLLRAIWKKKENIMFYAIQGKLHFLFGSCL